MKRRWIAVALALVIMLNISSAFPLTIKQPGSNSVFYPGQKIKVIIEAASNEDIVGIVVSTTPEGDSGLILKPPYEIELTMSDKYVGNARIRALARLKDDTAVESEIDISIQLSPNVKLEKILVYKYEPIIKALEGKAPTTEKLQAYGLFSDGVKRGLDIVEGLQFTSSNPNVVTVDSKGNLTALNLGKTTITILAGDKSETVNVKVYVNIDIDHELLVKPTDTGIQLDWKLSPQDPEWVTSYMVFRTEDPDGIVKTKIADLPKGTTTYVDKTAEKGKTYYYGVQAISATANERSSMTSMTPGIMH